MSVELFTVATQPTPGLTRLQSSLSKFNVPITILGQGEREYWGHGWRWKTFIRAARASTADTVIHCDGYDSVCLDSLPNLLAKFASLSHPVVFSFEPQAQPEPWLVLNSGLMMADRNALLAVFNEGTLEALFPDHFNDLYQIQSLYSWKPDAFKVDTQGVLFHTLGPRSPELVVQNGRLANPDTGKSPSFAHGPGNWDLSKVEQWVNAQN
jgi:hypothetical protein